MTSLITEGRVVGPVTVRHTPSGVPTAAATLAVIDRTRTIEGRWIDRAVSYYEVTVHGQLAEGFAALGPAAAEPHRAGRDRPA